MASKPSTLVWIQWINLAMKLAGRLIDKCVNVPNYKSWKWRLDQSFLVILSEFKKKRKEKLKAKQKEVSDEENNMFYLTFFLITISLSD